MSVFYSTCRRGWTVKKLRSYNLLVLAEDLLEIRWREMKSILLIMLLFAFENAHAGGCDSLPGVSGVLHPGAIVMLGEIHGTVQGPQAVYTIVCHALNAGQKITVGLEIPIVEQPNMIEYLASNGSDSDRSNLIAGEFWQEDYQDGRRSQAMAELIESLRLARAKDTARIRVIFLDNPGATQGRDRFMAERIVDESARYPERLIISLTGNVHSQLTSGNGYDESYEPMGYIVSMLAKEIDIYSLDIEHSGGTAWIDVDGQGYGVVSISGSGDDEGMRIEISGDSGHRHFGIFNTGTIEASRPARER